MIFDVTAGLFKVFDLVILTFVARRPSGRNPRLLPAATPFPFLSSDPFFPRLMQPS